MFVSSLKCLLRALLISSKVIIAFLFSVTTYFLNNFRPTATAFFTWIMWLFLDLLAAESLVVLVSSLFPSFVISLALTAFANGLWMSVGGFLVPPHTLNVFWRYVFHYIDYQVVSYHFTMSMSTSMDITFVPLAVVRRELY